MALKEILKQKKISQEQIVRFFLKHNHYKYQQQVSDWITGKRLPDITSVYYLSKLLNCSADEIIAALPISGADKP